VVLVDGTAARGAARVGEVAAHRALEEALAALARVLAVVLARALVSTHHTLRPRSRTRLLLLMVVVMMSVVSGASVWYKKGKGSPYTRLPSVGFRS